jgi:hypothetical protein
MVEFTEPATTALSRAERRETAKRPKTAWGRVCHLKRLKNRHFIGTSSGGHG